MTRSRSASSLPLQAVARTAGLGLLAASLLAGCVVVDGRGVPPPHAPAYGARAIRSDRHQEHSINALFFHNGGEGSCDILHITGISGAHERVVVFGQTSDHTG